MSSSGTEVFFTKSPGKVWSAGILTGNHYNHNGRTRVRTFWTVQYTDKIRLIGLRPHGNMRTINGCRVIDCTDIVNQIEHRNFPAFYIEYLRPDGHGLFQVTAELAVQEWQQKIIRLIGAESNMDARQAMRVWRDKCLAELATVLERVAPTKGASDE